MLGLSSLIFIQCTSDPIPGPPGKDGTNGIDGINGVDGSAAVCISCHSNQHRAPIKAAYATSVHATGGHVFGDSPARAVCSRCHSNEGFSDQISNGSFNPSGYASVSPITCTGCHDDVSGHRSFDFANDGNDFSLRTLDAVSLIVDSTYTIDIRNESDLLGKSNTCVNCHQPRTPVPTAADAVNGKIMVTSPYWGPHHGPQSTMLEGIQGAEIAGAIGYPTGQFPHRANSSCVECHMSKGTDATNGGHTWNPTRNACASCHDINSFTEFDRNGFQTETNDRMATLLGLLQNVVGQDITKDANGDYQPVFEADGVTPVTHVSMIDPTNGHAILGLYNFKDVQAAWNYILVREDRSEGVHNPAYVDALLPNSIQALQP